MDEIASHSLPSTSPKRDRTLFLQPTKSDRTLFYSTSPNRDRTLFPNIITPRSHPFYSTQSTRDRIPSLQSNHAREFPRSR
ncbi:hypothetical protein MC7420_2496 [Coleofasciculus chthonoplastes PCC 7420]|uniref:Uncharacterized protein n=1 Tax=Coleofasciculus chthonoplastes PCC 7420 TaxID=118168 RepID=B4VZQ8_9CYAN|nr:hypothetical protein [Coleofasciculus chthonoplastes]EDX72588.1 hypothetical protein MC7420_2496 [Coleofasciculus chthonoplastes PCC 7420]